jgi:hypothetical protein
VAFEVGDPGAIRCRRVELAAHQIGRASGRGVGNRGAMRLPVTGSGEETIGAEITASISCLLNRRCPVDDRVDASALATAGPVPASPGWALRSISATQGTPASADVRADPLLCGAIVTNLKSSRARADVTAAARQPPSSPLLGNGYSAPLSRMRRVP